jgi:NAD(P)-dependent dehydrogenase (short-subunit alcohol dehydrogenase family)
MSARHEDRVALVTGAGSGIGRATAIRLAREGALVVACDIDDARLEESLAEVGGEALGVAGDVARQEDVDRIVREAVSARGRVDVLANVAGINDWLLPAHEIDDDTWHRVMAVNVTGPMMLCRAVLPGMMERRSGSIVNVSSVGGLRGGTSGIAYTASKHALIGLTRSIAWTYRAEGIRCNAVCPGAVATNILDTSAPRSEWGFERLSKVFALLDGFAEADDVAALLSWVSSEEAARVNGAVVTADGGWSAA